MKKGWLKANCFFVLICCTFVLLPKQYAAAQQNITTAVDDIFYKYADAGKHKNFISPFYICQRSNAFPENTVVIRQLNATTAIIKIADTVTFTLLLQQSRLAAANNIFKLSGNAVTAGKGLQTYIVSGTDTDTLLTALKQIQNHIIIVDVNRPSHSVIIKTTVDFFKTAVLPLPQIIFADIKLQPHTEINIIGYDRSFNGINVLDFTVPGANGKNITVGVKEQLMEAADLDLYKRVLPSSIAATATASHATVIASIIGGAGNSFYDGRGIANGCTFFSSTFANLFADDAGVLVAGKVTVQNHSYGTAIQQFYGAEAVSYDAQLWQYKNLLHVFSAGNRGTAFATEGKYANINGYANLTGNFKMAKNIITVAAIDNKGNIAVESSAGPLYDGRMAPQITALGPNGTSDAAAVVSGTIAVLQQVYKDSNNQNLPPAALVKAILYNTADDIFNAGPDYKTGYGLVNSYAAVKALQQKKYDGSNIAQNQQWIKTITVPANAALLKVTLAYTDTAAAINNSKAIINDIDLEVLEVNTGVLYKPWVLSTAASNDSLAKPPVRKRDSLNTAEQVSIALPAAGNYQIKINGTTINTSALPFSVAFAVDTLNTFRFINPQHTADVNRQEKENLLVKWKASIADTSQTANLYISYNNGAAWQLLQAAQKLNRSQFEWRIKDTASQALFKMETAFGDFLSASFVISKVSNLNVDFVCADSFRLSWNKHIYAGSYTIFALTDSAYLKPVFTVADTFQVFKRNTFPWLVYAVQPVLSNNLPAARSIAADITQQGVQCFYKTLYYNLQDGNKLDMIVELSIASYADSIYFETVSATGQLLKTHGGVKVQSSNALSHYFINSLAAGTAYLRAKIKLNNGNIVFTEVVSVLTSGNKYILFYPNPVNRNSQLNYMLQQGLPSGSQLQMFDFSGRRLKNYSALPNRINLSAFAGSIIIYKLISVDNTVLETGKIFVQ